MSVVFNEFLFTITINISKMTCKKVAEALERMPCKGTLFKEHFQKFKLFKLKYAAGKQKYNALPQASLIHCVL